MLFTDRHYCAKVVRSDPTKQLPPTGGLQMIEKFLGMQTNFVRPPFVRPHFLQKKIIVDDVRQSRTIPISDGGCNFYYRHLTSGTLLTQFSLLNPESTVPDLHL